MNFFNRFRKNAESDHDSRETSTNWDNLSTRQNFDDQTQLHTNEINQAKEQIAKSERQERKAIAAILHGPNYLAQHDVEITDRDREMAYQDLANHAINETCKSDLLKSIKSPVHQSPEQTINNLNTKHERRILAYLSGTGFDAWESTSINDLQNTLSRFPTPYELAATEKDFLDNIRDHNTPAKYAEYQNAMESFKRKFYGKRYEYYNAIETLQQKADQKATTDAARTEVLNTYINNTPPQAPEIITQPIEIRPLSSKEQKKILKASKVDGDAFIENGNAYQLVPPTLEQLGLAPNYSFQLKNAQINLSDPYNVNGHTAVTAYVQTDKGTKVCSYYRSNSQGNWRLLPDYVADGSTSSSGKVIDWFGKGYSEDSMTLPSETQYALEAISTQRPSVQLPSITAEFVFAGTAKRYNSRDEYRTNMRQHTLRGQIYEEINSEPSFNLGKLDYVKNPPETLDIVGSSAPNFQKIRNPYSTNTGLYGQISVEHIPSEDNYLQYTFNRNANGQAWLSNIEIKNAEISSSGLRTAWASAGDYGTPLYEYASQANGYGDNDRRGNYVNMWANYLSRMPLIKKYLASRHA